MNINNYLQGNKFSKSKKSLINNSVSSKLNDSLNSDIKRHSYIDSSNTHRHGTNITHNYNDKQRYNDDQQFDDNINKQYQKREVNTFNQEQIRRQIDSQTQRSAIDNIQKKPKTKFQIPNKNTIEPRQQSNLKSQKQKVQGLIQQLSLQSLTQLQIVDKIIGSLDKKVAILIDSEFNKFKDAILLTFSNFKKAFQLQKQKCFNKVKQVKKQLQQMNENLQVIKKQMKTSNWNKVQQNLKQANIQKYLNVFRQEIQKYKKTLPISICIKKSKVKNYQQALIGLLNFRQVQTQHNKR